MLSLDFLWTHSHRRGNFEVLNMSFGQSQLQSLTGELPLCVLLLESNTMQRIKRHKTYFNQRRAPPHV